MKFARTTLKSCGASAIPLATRSLLLVGFLVASFAATAQGLEGQAIPTRSWALDFGQNTMIFDAPADFVVVTDAEDNFSQTIELVSSGEDADNWHEMIAVSRFLVPRGETAADVTEALAYGVGKVCPSDPFTDYLDSGTIDGVEVVVSFLGCPAYPDPDGQSYFGLTITAVSQGEAISLQWFDRGQSQAGNGVLIDSEVIEARYQYLEPRFRRN